MKKIFLILIVFLIFSIIYIPQKANLAFNHESDHIEEFFNDEQCLNAVKLISASFPTINTVSVLQKKNSCLCGITTSDNNTISKSAIEKILYETFPKTKFIRLEINSDRAEDILELSYFASSALKEKYISLRYDFLISED